VDGENSQQVSVTYAEGTVVECAKLGFGDLFSMSDTALQELQQAVFQSCCGGYKGISK
jgi:hypothetical protein